MWSLISGMCCPIPQTYLRYHCRLFLFTGDVPEFVHKVDVMGRFVDGNACRRFLYTKRTLPTSTHRPLHIDVIVPPCPSFFGPYKQVSYPSRSGSRARSFKADGYKSADNCSGSAVTPDNCSGLAVICCVIPLLSVCAYWFVL